MSCVWNTRFCFDLKHLSNVPSGPFSGAGLHQQSHVFPMVTNVSNDGKFIGNYLAIYRDAGHELLLAGCRPLYSFIAFARTLPEYLFVSVDVIAHNKRVEQQHPRGFILFFGINKRGWIQFTLDIGWNEIVKRLTQNDVLLLLNRFIINSGAREIDYMTWRLASSRSAEYKAETMCAVAAIISDPR